MQRLIEDAFLRNKLYIFKDRKEAGTLLAQRLLGYKDTDGIVFAIPSGGVPVAAEIAKVLSLPLDLIIVRVEIILPEVDELACLNIRSGYAFAVANAYENWYDPKPCLFI